MLKNFYEYVSIKSRIMPDNIDKIHTTVMGIDRIKRNLKYLNLKYSGGGCHGTALGRALYEGNRPAGISV